MDKKTQLESLKQIIEILRPLNISLNAPAQTPIETAYFHICSLYARLSIDEVRLGG